MNIRFTTYKGNACVEIKEKTDPFKIQVHVM